jgi:hypothetical protein
MKQQDDSLFLKVVKDIRKAKSNRINFIPFSNFKRFSNDYFGIIKDDYTIITSGSGTGKSKFTFNQYILEPLNYIANNPYNDIDVKIFYNSLEESSDKVIYNIICNLLFKNGIYVDIRKLKGIPDKDSLTDELITKIESLRPFFDVLESKVEISSFNKSTKHIFNNTKKFLDRSDIGTNIIQPNGERIYVPKNPNLYVEHITDHIGLLEPSKEEGTIERSISQHSQHNNLELKNYYKCQVVDVQQQSAASESLEFNYKGILNEQKMKPSREGLALNKNTYNNCSFMIGLFAPFRHKILDYNGYDISNLEDGYRYIEILKARDGALCGVDVFYNGAVGSFEELPKELRTRDYDKYKVIMNNHRVVVKEENNKDLLSF